MPPRDDAGRYVVHPVVAAVTDRIARRSAPARAAYLQMLDAEATAEHPRRSALGCANQVHGFAACGPELKLTLRGRTQAQLGIVTAYNDMLSAHQPFQTYPDIIKAAAREVHGVAQVAGGVPAMCDGITQGYPGMELSLFSRDVVAMATAVGLSHDVFDGTVMLGVCDKIVPGLIIGALQFGHLPAALIPAGPMSTGLSNNEKKRVRNLYAEGKVDREELIDAESASYHSAGTCTFYGTANSNQMVVEVMGMHLPGTAFVPPDSELRPALTAAITQRVLQITSLGDQWTPFGRLVDEKAIVNAVVGLLATGGSTNHTMHLVAIAAAAGIILTWSDIDELSKTVPLLTRMYPNGSADVNQFHAAGGTPFLIGTLLDAGLVHEDVLTLAGPGLSRYRYEPVLDDDARIQWRRSAERSGDETVLRSSDNPFDHEGGIRVLDGTLGRAVIKVSSLEEKDRIVQAPARVFSDQASFTRAFEAGELDRDVIVVVRFQGPKANGMPELHKLIPAMSVLIQRGHHVALVTDGRMSGASGVVPAAIHITPEAADGGPLSRVLDGDLIRVDSHAGTIDVLVETAELLDRPAAVPGPAPVTLGRRLFESFRAQVGTADTGASVFDLTRVDPDLDLDLDPDSDPDFERALDRATRAASDRAVEVADAALEAS
ncbi:phosphogluconate dehydratase [Jatrophihabitans telluris]